jgi:tetratricopeptide (TPR) repeat protein
MFWGEGLAWLGKGETENARRAFVALSEAGGIYTTTGRLYLAQTKIYEGALEEATDELESDLGVDLKLGDQVHEEVRRYWLGQIFILRGRRSAAVRQLEALSRWKVLPSNLELLRNRAFLCRATGDLSRADLLIRQAERMHSEFPSNFSQAVLAQVRGELELLRVGHWEVARTNLEQAYALWGDASTLWSLANAYYAHKDYRRALTIYEQFLSRKGEVLRWEFSGLLPLAHLQAARCHRNLTDNDRATQEYNQFLRLWGDKGNQIPLVEEARREREVVTTFLESKKPT